MLPFYPASRPGIPTTQSLGIGLGIQTCSFKSVSHAGALEVSVTILISGNVFLRLLSSRCFAGSGFHVGILGLVNFSFVFD